MGATEKLEDPKKLKEQEMSDAKKRSAELDHELAPMHGAKAFMEFVSGKQGEKNVRKPEVNANSFDYRIGPNFMSADQSFIFYFFF